MAGSERFDPYTSGAPVSHFDSAQPLPREADETQREELSGGGAITRSREDDADRVRPLIA